MRRRATKRPTPPASKHPDLPLCSCPSEPGGIVPCDRYAKYQVRQGGQTQYLCDWHYESFLLYYEGENQNPPPTTPT